MTDSPTTDWHGLPGVDIYGKDLFQKKGEVHPEGGEKKSSFFVEIL